jgi:hypothetical protein
MLGTLSGFGKIHNITQETRWKKSRTFWTTCLGRNGDTIESPIRSTETKGTTEMTTEPREIRCDCGELIDIDGPLEDAHFVFAMRRNGERSNLGYCPVKRGMASAIREARNSLSGVALYHGKVI